MKSLFAFSFSILIFLSASATTCFAQDKAPLGVGTLMLKLDYIEFTDSFFSAPEESDGLYIGLEGYYRVANNLYVGGEFGQAANITLFGGEEIDFVPVELNTKYAFDAGMNLVLDFGAGISYNRTQLTHDVFLGNNIDRGSDWLLGGQIFTDLTFKIGWLAIGLNGKYQITERFKDSDIKLSNYRLGLSLGGCF